VQDDALMPTDLIDVARVVDMLSTTDSNGERTADVFCTLVRELAGGEPVSKERLAAALGWTASQVDAALCQIHGMEFDDDGRIVGYGLTLRETQHAFEVAGRRLFTWCALDALMIPVLRGGVARISSSCAGTGTPVRMTVSPDGVSEIEPGGAAVTLVSPKAAEDLRGAFCCRVQFFASAGDARMSVCANAAIVVVGVHEAFKVGISLVRELNARTGGVLGSSGLPTQGRLHALPAGME